VREPAQRRRDLRTGERSEHEKEGETEDEEDAEDPGDKRVQNIYIYIYINLY
jgi:hypothetical protein